MRRQTHFGTYRNHNAERQRGQTLRRGKKYRMPYDYGHMPRDQIGQRGLIYSAKIAHSKFTKNQRRIFRIAAITSASVLLLMLFDACKHTPKTADAEPAQTLVPLDSTYNLIKSDSAWKYLNLSDRQVPIFVDTVEITDLQYFDYVTESGHYDTHLDEIRMRHKRLAARVGQPSPNMNDDFVGNLEHEARHARNHSVLEKYCPSLSPEQIITVALSDEISANFETIGWQYLARDGKTVSEIFQAAVSNFIPVAYYYTDMALMACANYSHGGSAGLNAAAQQKVFYLAMRDMFKFRRDGDSLPVSFWDSIGRDGQTEFLNQIDEYVRFTLDFYNNHRALFAADSALVR